MMKSSLDFQKNILIIYKLWGRKGFDWIKKLKRARQRAAWLCKNAETLSANTDTFSDYALAA